MPSKNAFAAAAKAVQSVFETVAAEFIVVASGTGATGTGSAAPSPSSKTTPTMPQALTSEDKLHHVSDAPIVR